MLVRNDREVEFNFSRKISEILTDGKKNTNMRRPDQFVGDDGI
jgi:hypothetical protein